MKFGIHITLQKKFSIPEYAITANISNSVVSDFDNNIFILKNFENTIFLFIDNLSLNLI